MPNVVKGSRQQKMVVVPYQPGRRALAALLMLLLIAIGLAGGYWYGVTGARMNDGQFAVMQQRIRALEAENVNMSQELTLLERSSIMDQQVSSEIQTTILEMREYISKLEQDVEFYRQAMTKDFADVGLVVGQMDIEATDQPDRFRYKLVMRQEESSGDYLTGHVNVDIVGARGGTTEVIPLHELSNSEEQADIRLRFRYFQNIEGELRLPPDFRPQRVEISAVSTAPMAKSVNRSYNWVVEGD